MNKLVLLGLVLLFSGCNTWHMNNNQVTCKDFFEYTQCFIYDPTQGMGFLFDKQFQTRGDL